MEFGKVRSRKVLDNIDFQLPEIPQKTISFLQRQAKSKPLEVFVGCPVWVNKRWLGSTYPDKTKEKDFFREYAKQFNTIELNSTHYHIPTTQTIKKWKSQSTKGFKFSPKFPQEISHHLIAKGSFEDLTKVFVERVSGLGEHLGTSFLQLPPYFSTKERPALEKFIKRMPEGLALALEFRHQTWFKQNDPKSIIDFLENYQVGTVITDVAGRRDVLHLSLTTSSLMLRFVGNGLIDSDYKRLEDWVEKIAELITLGLQELYFFAHQPDNDLSPQTCRFFIESLNKACSLDIKTPYLYKEDNTQKSLF